jgi:hypothetical protein
MCIKLTSTRRRSASSTNGRLSQGVNDLHFFPANKQIKIVEMREIKMGQFETIFSSFLFLMQL